MEPYFTDGTFTLYCGDQAEVLPALEPVDMVLTDPPYLFKKGDGGGTVSLRDGADRVHDKEIYKKHGADGTLDYEVDLTEFAKKRYYIGDKINGVIFCTMYSLPKFLSYLDDNQIRFTVLVWHKTNPLPMTNNRYLGDLEYLVYFKKGKTMGGTYETKSRLYSSQINTADKDKWGHPTIKPLPLIEKFVYNHTERGDTVLDPFAGTGTTAVACARHNRKCIGVELKEEYCKIAVDRYQQEIAKSKLF